MGAPESENDKEKVEVTFGRLHYAHKQQEIKANVILGELQVKSP